MGYIITKMENLLKRSDISIIWCFCRRFLKQNKSMHSVKSFSACFCEEKVENNLPILHGLLTYQNGESSKCSYISTIWCFCTQFFAQKNPKHSEESFSGYFCKKNRENNLPIFHGLLTYQNGESSKCSYISTIWCFCTQFFAQNISMHSEESFSGYLKKKNVKITCHFSWAIDLQKWRIFKMLLYLDFLVFLHAVFCTEQLFAFRKSISACFCGKKS